MQKIQFGFDPYKNITNVSIDGEPLSQNSELNSYRETSLLNWAKDFFNIIDNEMNDEYQLDIRSEKFEKFFLQDLSAHDEYCSGISYTAFSVATEPRRRMSAALRLMKTCQVSVPQYKFKLPVYSESEIIADSRWITNVDLDKAFLIISDSYNDIPLNFEGYSPRIVLAAADKAEVLYREDGCYLWKVEEQRLEAVFDSIVERFAIIPYIAEAVKQIGKKATCLTGDEFREYILLNATKPIITVDEIGNIEVGKKLKPVFRMIPQKYPLPQIEITSTDGDIVRAAGDCLEAVSVGETQVYFREKGETSYFQSVTVKTFQNIYVDSIKLTPEKTSMNRGSRQKISALLEPENADDKDELVWTVNRPEIARVNSKGYLTAISGGDVEVTASTKKVSSRVAIHVISAIEKISLSESDIQLFVGDTQKIIRKIQPAFVDNPTCNWTSDDDTVAMVQPTEDENTFVVKALSIGHCKLTCKAEQGGAKASCDVSVESTFNKRKASGESSFIVPEIFFAIMTIAFALVQLKLEAVIAFCAAVYFGIKEVRNPNGNKNKAILILGAAFLGLILVLVL